MNPIRFPYQIVMTGLLLTTYIASSALEIKAKAARTATNGDEETWAVQVKLENNLSSATAPFKLQCRFCGFCNGSFLGEFPEKTRIGTKSARPLNPPSAHGADADSGPWQLVTDGRSEFSCTTLGVPIPKVFAILHAHGSAYLLQGSPRSVRCQKTAATENLQQTMYEIDRPLEMRLNQLVLQFIGTTIHQDYLLSCPPSPSPKPNPPWSPRVTP